MTLSIPAIDSYWSVRHVRSTHVTNGVEPAIGAPSTVHTWVDHIVAPALSIDAETGGGLLGGTDFIVLASRAGGYGPGTPR